MANIDDSSVRVNFLILYRGPEYQLRNHRGRVADLGLVGSNWPLTGRQIVLMYSWNLWNFDTIARCVFGMVVLLI